MSPLISFDFKRVFTLFFISLFLIDSKMKYNEGVISDELNENDKGKNKNNIFEKKLNLNENKLNLKENIESDENLNEIFRKHGKSCKVMKNK